MLATLAAMDQPDPTASDALMPPQLGEADIVARLDEAEADEAEGRLTDGAELVRDLRRRADGLQARTVQRRA